MSLCTRSLRTHIADLEALAQDAADKDWLALCGFISDQVVILKKRLAFAEKWGRDAAAV